MERSHDREQETIWGKTEFSWLSSGFSLSLFKSGNLIELCYESYKTLKESQLSQLEKYWEEAKQNTINYERKIRECEERIDSAIIEYLTTKEMKSIYDKDRLLLRVDDWETRLSCMKNSISSFRKTERILRVMIELKHQKNR